jgi:hypothetical protein
MLCFRNRVALLDVRSDEWWYRRVTLAPIVNVVSEERQMKFKFRSGKDPPRILGVDAYKYYRLPGGKFLAWFKGWLPVPLSDLKTKPIDCCHRRFR